MTTEFTKILTEIQEMHDKKQSDYGREGDPFANVRASEDFGIPGWVGCMTRAHDKMVRLQKAARGGKMTNESVEDSLLDLAVYTIIALVLRREELDGIARLQESALLVDTGESSYFATGKRCGGTYVDRIEGNPERTYVDGSIENFDSAESVADFKSPSASESKRIGNLLSREADSDRQLFRGGVFGYRRLVNKS